MSAVRLPPTPSPTPTVTDQGVPVSYVNLAVGLTVSLVMAVGVTVTVVSIVAITMYVNCKRKLLAKGARNHEG